MKTEYINRELHTIKAMFAKAVEEVLIDAIGM
jgi:hypothetical protein